ncbi:hypothetical protein ACFCYH_09015 [Streptomyces sp. NPDC056400]|uniref:hypothetical protein n=1 Tax=Streptomyces sp. NPDC056400 TaxID=3345808 RepID=UPI0035DC1EDE
MAVLAVPVLSLALEMLREGRIVLRSREHEADTLAAAGRSRAGFTEMLAGAERTQRTRSAYWGVLLNRFSPARRMEGRPGRTRRSPGCSVRWPPPHPGQAQAWQADMREKEPSGGLFLEPADHGLGRSWGGPTRHTTPARTAPTCADAVSKRRSRSLRTASATGGTVAREAVGLRKIDKTDYRQRRAVATRCDKLAGRYGATVLVAALNEWP